MKNVVKWAIYIIGFFIFLLILIFGFIQIRGIPSYDTVSIAYDVESSPKRVERGGKLVKSLCIGCHVNRQLGNLSGGKMMDAPKEFGEIYAPNITKDTQYGIGGWTDAEIMYLLRTGIKRDGSYVPPYMAKLPMLSDEDMASIISFLRSEDPMVKASSTPDKASEPSFLTKFLSNTIFKPFPLPETKIADPDTSNSIELGRYLAFNLECYSCHSADFKTNNFFEPEKSVGYFAGGNKTLNLLGDEILTANLTPDKETGIGDWTKEQFVKAVKSGQVEGGNALRYPMNPYVHFSEKEIGAIYDYLQSIPPIKNDVKRSGL